MSLTTDTPQLPNISFSSFIVSLTTSAMQHLGEGPAAAEDLAMAKQTIDLLSILKDKTEGNLDEEETKLMEAVLYETRMKFLAKTQA